MSIVVDGHCHVGVGHDYGQTPENLLRDMDAHGVDRAVICPVDRCIAVDNREGNDFVLSVASAHVDRFYPFATANPWYGPRAVAELRRALQKGAAGIKLHPALQGFLLCDEIVHPIIELAGEHDVPVFFHTGTPAYSQPMQVAELALRFPSINFIMGHMGSTDYWLDAVPAALEAPNVYVDTSWSLPQKIERAVAAIGANRVLFGTDSPLSSLELEMACMREAAISDAAREMVLAGTMLRLLGRIQ